MEKDSTRGPEPSFHQRWVKLAEKYLREIIIVVVVAVIGAAAWGLYNHQKAQQEAEASLRLTTAEAKSPQEYRQVLKDIVKKYPHTGAATLARIMLAEGYRQDQQYKKAQEELKSALKTASKANQPFLLLGLGYLYEDEEDYHQAASYYQKALSFGEGIEEIVYLDLARVQEASGQIQAALSAYEKLIERKPFGQRLFFVEAKLAELQQKIKKGGL